MECSAPLAEQFAAMPSYPQAFERIKALRRLVYNSKDYLEGQKAFLEKRPPVF